MPRLPFNTSATFYQGPAAASPGSVRWSGPCRFVRADGIHLVGDGAPSVVGWVTFESGEPVGSWFPDLFGLKPSLADQVSIPGDADPAYFVLWVERVIWGGADYYRAVVASLPLPDACDCHGPPDPCAPNTCETADALAPGWGDNAVCVHAGTTRYYVASALPYGTSRFSARDAGGFPVSDADLWTAASCSSSFGGGGWFTDWYTSPPPGSCVVRVTAGLSDISMLRVGSA